MKPIECNFGCRCYYVQDKGNIFDCSQKYLKQLPPNNTVPNTTEYLDLSQSNFRNLCGKQSYWKYILGLRVNKAKIQSICDQLLETIEEGKLQVLDLFNNSLERIPKRVRNINSITEINLSENPFVCDCEMLWMRNWLMTFNLTKEQLLRVKCRNGTSILNLDGTACFSKDLPTWQKVLVGLSAGLTILIVTTIIAISRRWNEVKWFMYLHFDILDRNDGNENIEDKEFDAFISYR